MMGAHLSKELSQSHKIKTLPVRKGDTVKLMRGQFKGTTGKVERVSLKRERVFIEKVELVKADGSKAKYPIHPSNLLITSLNLSDDRRIKRRKNK